MKRRGTLLAALAACLFLGFGEKASGAELSFVAIAKNTPIFDMIDGKQVQIGTLSAGQSYSLRGEDATHYFIKFGNCMGFFPKVMGKKAPKATYKNMNTRLQNTNTAVITKSTAAIVDMPTVKGKTLAVVNTNIRYPIVSKEKNWYKVDVGNRIGYIDASKVTEDNGLPVLMYHHMLEDPNRVKEAKGNQMVIKVSAFEEQMHYLKANGWRTITMEELEQYMLRKKNLTGKVAVITFDDGYVSSLKYAYDIMKANGQKATQFVIGGKTRGSAPEWDENVFQNIGIQEMAQTTDVFDYQSHTNGLHLYDAETHKKPQMLIKSFDEIKADLIAGRTQVSKFDQKPERIKYLAYPFGARNANAVKATKEAGFHMAVTTDMGNVKLGDDFLQLKRQGVAQRHTMKDFVNKLNGTYKEKK